MPQFILFLFLACICLAQKSKLFDHDEDDGDHLPWGIKHSELVPMKNTFKYWATKDYKRDFEEASTPLPVTTVLPGQGLPVVSQSIQTPPPVLQSAERSLDQGFVKSILSKAAADIQQEEDALEKGKSLFSAAAAHFHTKEKRQGVVIDETLIDTSTAVAVGINSHTMTMVVEDPHTGPLATSTTAPTASPGSSLIPTTIITTITTTTPKLRIKALAVAHAEANTNTNNNLAAPAADDNGDGDVPAQFLPPISHPPLDASFNCTVCDPTAIPPTTTITFTSIYASDEIFIFTTTERKPITFETVIKTTETSNTKEGTMETDEEVVVTETETVVGSTTEAVVLTTTEATTTVTQEEEVAARRARKTVVPREVAGEWARGGFGGRKGRFG